MENKENKKITQAVEAAVKIIKDNPELKYFEAIKKAKEMYEVKNDKMV